MTPAISEAMVEARKPRNCATCAGTGRLVLMKSWFPGDGFTSCRCGICAGTGKSNYRAPDYALAQQYLRTISSEQSP